MESKECSRKSSILEPNNLRSSEKAKIDNSSGNHSREMHDETDQEEFNSELKSYDTEFERVLNDERYFQNLLMGEDSEPKYG